MNKKEVELTKYFDNMCIIFNTKNNVIMVDNQPISTIYIDIKKLFF